MQCPVCGERMREIEKHGVTIDICPGCKGVWLDRGELEKLIATLPPDASSAPPDAPRRDAPDAPQAPPAAPTYERRWRDDDEDDDDRFEDRRRYGDRYPHESNPHHDDGHRRDHQRPHRKKHWLSEVFEVFGD